jgi:glycosyltransferase involved in cell wall biosynthesis
MSTHFKIIIPAYNTEDWIENALISVLNQDYDDFECIITNDCSEDKTSEKVRDFISDNEAQEYFILYENAERKYALYNIHMMIREMNAEDEDVIICLDGDDWLSGDKVLSRLDEIYEEEDCWLTYGSYMRYPDGWDSSFHVSEYPKEIKESGDFRKDSQWRASHLRSFKYKIAKRLEESDFLDKDGNYYQMAWDQAVMFPLMEMACEKVHFVPETLYVYNDDNPINVHKIDRQKQIEVSEDIRANHAKKESLIGVI